VTRTGKQQESSALVATIRRVAVMIAVAMLIALASACSLSSEEVTTFDLLEPCTNEEGPVDALCGTVEVFEDRQAQAGRKIALKLVVLPALSNKPSPDPLFILAGGPGMGAAENAALFRRVFERFQTSRDIVLVDQRGTGESNPLDCDSPEPDFEELVNFDADPPLDDVRACLEGYDADPRHYTTSVAMDDLDEVRAFLGYEVINLYGGSYGTRAGLVYLRRHPERVRAVVLDGVAPPDMKLPLSAPLDGQRALDLLIADCEADAACNERFPDLGGKVRGLLARLEKQPARVRLQHPRTGEWADVEIGRPLMANALFGAFYSPLTTSLLPLLIERAEQNDFQAVIAMGFANEDVADLLSPGMFLSVICNEDVPRVTGQDRDRMASESFLGDLFRYRLRPCGFWPRTEIAEEYYEPVKSDAPVLILSGQLDPVTPPRWGDHIAEHLPNARHLVVPGVGHGVMGQGCVTRLVNQFIDEGTAENLDANCIEQLRRPPFFITPAGPRRESP